MLVAAHVTTATRRGLVLSLYADALLVAGALAFVLWPSRVAWLITGVVLSGLVGLPGGWALWGGRREFGEGHARSLRRAAVAFGLLVFSLVLAFFQVASVFPESLRVADLRAPWFFLLAGLLLDAFAIAFSLWHLAGAQGRPWLAATLGLGVLAALFHAWFGWAALDRLLAVSGGAVLHAAEASSYVHDFNRDVTRIFAAGLLLLRIGYWPALWRSISNVAEAEQAYLDASLPNASP